MRRRSVHRRVKSGRGAREGGFVEKPYLYERDASIHSWNRNVFGQIEVWLELLVPNVGINIRQRLF